MGVHDSGYKHLFSFRTMVADLLRGFVREQWIGALDFETLERKNQSFVTDDLREREDDIIWRAKWKKSENWMYVYFLIEFQSEPDKYMALRMVNYVTLLYQDLIKSGEVHGRRLPPVLPMVVYRGEPKWMAPLDVKELIESPSPGLVRYLPSMRFLLLEEVLMDTTELARMSNLAAEVFRIENSPELAACIPPFVSFLRWTQRAGDEQDALRRAFTAWFTRAQKPAKLIDDEFIDGDFSPEEMEPMLSERIEKWSRALKSEGRLEGKAEGLLEGKAEGRLEGKAEGLLEGKAEGEVSGIQKVAKNMLKKGISVTEIAEVTGLLEKEILTLVDNDDLQ